MGSRRARISDAAIRAAVGGRNLDKELWLHEAEWGDDGGLIYYPDAPRIVLIGDFARRLAYLGPRFEWHLLAQGLDPETVETHFAPLDALGDIPDALGSGGYLPARAVRAFHAVNTYNMAIYLLHSTLYPDSEREFEPLHVAD